jgi:hypothetical protein
MGHYRSYPTGYRVEDLGTFPADGCPHVGKAADG